MNVSSPTDTLTIANGQIPPMTIPALTAKIYIAQAQWQPLAPLVSYINPPHDAANVATVSKIIVGFTHPMDTASVESAFTTVPATSGRFTWSADQQTLTYQAIGGLPSLTTLTVQIGTGATDTSGQHLFVGFAARFTTRNGGASDVVPPTMTITSPQDGAVVDYQHGVAFTAVDDVNIDNIEQQIDDGPWTSLINHDNYTPQKTFTSFANLPFQYMVNGPHTISLRATDTSANVSDVAAITVRFFTKPGPYDIRSFAWDTENGGNGSCDNSFWLSTPPYTPKAIFQSSNGRPYGFIGGTYYNSSNSITNVCYNDQFIYTAERYCSPVETIRYLFHCPPGVYQVTLHEAETNKSGANQRRFDVYLQGAKSFPNLDIFAAAGGANRAVTFTNQTTVTNGVLEVLFKPVFDYARSSGIHLQKIADIYSDSDGIPDWWRLGVFGHATGLDADQSRASDDPDQDGRTNLEEYRAGTDPRDRASALKIVAINRANTDISVMWQSVDGVYYQLQRNDSFDPGSWINVGSAQRGFGGTTGTSDYGGATRATHQFYRVLVVPSS